MGTSDDGRAKVQRLLVTGDTRLKQGVATAKVRASYLAALEQKDNTNHPRNPGYHSSREAVAKFESAYPLSVPKVQEYKQLDALWGPTRTERAHQQALKKELGLG